MNYKKWILVLITNLLIVALLGFLMRYKIAFSFPYLEQKHLQHAHSHFAFAAWISQALYLMLIYFLDQHIQLNWKKYNLILIANTVFSIGMMISFILYGYHVSSNTFSFLIVLTAVLFSFFFIKDTLKFKEQAFVKHWFYAALFFNFISNFGTFYIAYLMISKSYQQDVHLASVYFYLHFQYNGWFIFSCFGLMCYQLLKNMQIKNSMTIFWVFFLSTFPSYFLSILWFKIPLSLYIIVVLSSLLQLLIWVYLLLQISTHKKKFVLSTDKYFSRIVWVILFSFTLKLILQLVSTVPFISHIAYSLRSIVIAYLHLVLLVIISMFILHYLFRYVLLKSISKYIYYFLIIIIINEILLGIQGFAGMFTISILNIQYYLFFISIFIVLSLISIFRHIQTL
jgi:hypothetical protein